MVTSLNVLDFKLGIIIHCRASYVFVYVYIYPCARGRMIQMKGKKISMFLSNVFYSQSFQIIA